MMVLMCGLTAALILGLWLPASSEAATIAFTVLFGLSSGAGVGLTPALCAGIAPLEELGIWTGTTFSIAAVAALTGSPIAGQLVSAANGDFTNAAIFGGVNCAVGTLLFFASRKAVLGGFSFSVSKL